jgi:hypothetical protein
VGTGLFGCLYCLLTAEKIVYNALNNCVVSVAPSSNKLCMFNVCTGRFDCYVQSWQCIICALLFSVGDKSANITKRHSKYIHSITVSPFTNVQSITQTYIQTYTNMLQATTGGAANIQTNVTTAAAGAEQASATEGDGEGSDSWMGSSNTAVTSVVLPTATIHKTHR